MSLTHAEYLTPVIDNLFLTIENAKASLWDIEFEGFVGMGISGALPIGALAIAMNKRIAIVRKEKDGGSHSDRIVECGLHAGDRWIFVDDFISSGETKRKVCDAMLDLGVREGQSRIVNEFIGVYLYSSYGYRSKDRDLISE